MPFSLRTKTALHEPGAAVCRFRSWLLLVLVDLVLMRPLVLTEGMAVWTLRYSLNYAFSLLVVYAFLWMLQTIARVRTPARVSAVAATVALPILVQIGHASVYQKFSGTYVFGFVLENAGLTAQLAGWNIPWARGLLALPLLVAAAFLLLPPVRKQTRPTWVHRTLAWGTGVLAVVSLVFGAVHWTGVPEYQHGLTAFGTTSVAQLRTWHFSRVVERRTVPPRPAAPGELPDIVWVIGESLNRDHMGLFGYERPTTPELVKLRQEGWLKAFDNVISGGARTRSSFPMLLVGMQGPDPDGVVFERPTVFDYAKARGYHTVFISAQEISWGNLDALFLARNLDMVRKGTEFESDVDVLKGADDHKVLDGAVEPVLKTAQRPLFLVVQMDGSHYPYTTHSPPEYKRFLPEDEVNGINAYDNTVVYSDAYLGRLARALRAAGRPFWMFVTTDHGQDISEDGTHFNYSFTDQAVRVFLLAVASPELLSTLRAGTDAPLAHADMLATSLDLMASADWISNDGLSIRNEIPRARVRVTTSYVRTWHNEATAGIFPPEGAPLMVDFSRSQYEVPATGDTGPLSRLKPELLEALMRHVKSDESVVGAR